jgi:hypothetical protein
MICALLVAPSIAFGEDAITKIEPALIVMNARGVSLQGDKLTLNGG